MTLNKSHQCSTYSTSLVELHMACGLSHDMQCTCTGVTAEMMDKDNKVSQCMGSKPCQVQHLFHTLQIVDVELEHSTHC